jgi:hypothetical protein
MVTKSTADKKLEQQKKDEERLAKYKRELVSEIGDWIEKIATGNYTVDRVELSAHKGGTTVSVRYPPPYR